MSRTWTCYYADCSCFSDVSQHPSLVVEDFTREDDASLALLAHEDRHITSGGGHRYWTVHCQGRHMIAAYPPGIAPAQD